MGYQESYIRMSESRDFDKLVQFIKDCKRESFDYGTPVEIITLLKPISGNLAWQCEPEISYQFESGERFIYIVGERHNQRCADNFFKDCKKVPGNIKNGMQIYFTECFPSKDIFQNGYATHEKFPWD